MVMGNCHAIGKMGVGLLKKEQDRDEKIKAIYNDCWFIYKEFEEKKDIDLYIKRAAGLREKYDDDRFLVEVLSVFAPAVSLLYEEYVDGAG